MQDRAKCDKGTKLILGEGGTIYTFLIGEQLGWGHNKTLKEKNRYGRVGDFFRKYSWFHPARWNLLDCVTIIIGKFLCEVVSIAF